MSNVHKKQSAGTGCAVGYTCSACAARQRCPAAVTFSVWQCRAVKYAAAVGFITALWLMHVSTGDLVRAGGATSEVGFRLLLRTTLITSLFIVTMWAMNHIVNCAKRGECAR